MAVIGNSKWDKAEQNGVKWDEFPVNPARGDIFPKNGILWSEMGWIPA